MAAAALPATRPCMLSDARVGRLPVGIPRHPYTSNPSATGGATMTMTTPDTLVFDHTPTPEEIVLALVARGDTTEAITFMAMVEIAQDRGTVGPIHVTADDILDKIEAMGLSEAYDEACTAREAVQP